VGDLPHAVLIAEHQGGAQHGDDRVVVAGDPALVPLDLEDIAELRRGGPGDSSKLLDTSSKYSGPPSWKFDATLRAASPTSAGPRRGGSNGLPSVTSSQSEKKLIAGSGSPLT
jgi:hypothetical protein